MSSIEKSDFFFVFKFVIFGVERQRKTPWIKFTNQKLD